MCKKLYFFIFVINLMLSLTASAGDHVTIEDLDAVLKKAGTLEAFLANEDLQDEYFRLSSDYYGHNFAGRRDSYDVILNQMRIAVKQNPVLAEKLWSTQDLGTAFTIDSNITNRGIELNSTQYRIAWNNYVNEEKKILGGFKDKDLENYLRSEAKEISEYIKSEKLKVESEYQASTLPKSQRESLRGRAYANLQNDILGQEKFKKLVSGLVQELHQKEAFGDILNAGDANITLDFLDRFRAKSANMFGIQGLESTLETLHPYIIKSMPKELINPEIPRLVVEDGKAARTKFFTVKTKEVTVRDQSGKVISTKLIPEGTRGGGLEFKPIPRRFHGAFKGIELGECVAGGSCKTVSIERWGTSALEGSQHYYVENGHTYKGWVSLYPGEVQGKKVSNIEFGANVLEQMQPHNGKTYPLYEHTIDKLKERLPPGTTGFLVGDSNAIDNAGVISKVQKSLSYQVGDKVATRFEHKDQSTLNLIIKERARQNQSTMYAGNGIIDANQSKHGNTILDTSVILNDPPLDKKSLKKLIIESEKSQQSKRKAITIISRKENINLSGAIEFLIKESPTSRDAYRSLVYELGNPKVLKFFKERVVEGDTEAFLYLASNTNIKRPGVLQLLKTQIEKDIEGLSGTLKKGMGLTPEFHEVLIAMAKRGSSPALEIIAVLNTNLRDEVRELFIDQARKGSPVAIRVLGKSPEYGYNEEIRHLISDLAKNGSEEALEVIKDKGYFNESILEIAIDQAKKGSAAAIKILTDQKVIKPEHLEVVMDQAKKGNSTALYFLDHNIDHPENLEIIMDQAKKGNRVALGILSRKLNRPEILKIFEDLAVKGNSQAIYVLSSKDNFSDLIVDISKNNKQFSKLLFEELALNNNSILLHNHMKGHELIKNLAKKDDAYAIKILSETLSTISPVYGRETIEIIAQQAAKGQGDAVDAIKKYPQYAPIVHVQKLKLTSACMQEALVQLIEAVH
jgi:hypothetical protein